MRLTSGMGAVVTGGASGIGRAMATSCLARGLTVALLDIEQTALDTTVEELSSSGKVSGIVCDVADRASVVSAAERILSEVGVPGLLVCNAGVGTYGPPVWELTIEDWRWVIGVNLYGFIHCLGSFLPPMMEVGSGHVVAVSSAAGVMSPPGFAPYNASKHAMLTIAETLLHELRGAGTEIGVTVVLPGMVRTRMPDNARNRPPALSNSIDLERDRAERYRATVAGMRAANDSARDPGEIADQILRCVDENEFVVVLDEWIRSGGRQRMDALMSGEAPPSPG